MWCSYRASWTLLWSVPAQRHGQVEVGRAAAGPGILVMKLAPGVRPIAALSGALVVGRGECDALGLGEEAVRPTQVERQGAAVEHGRQDPCGAGRTASLARRQVVPGVEVGGSEALAQAVVVDGHDDRGGDLAGEAVGGEVLEQLDERRAVPLGPVACRRGVRARCRAAGRGRGTGSSPQGSTGRSADRAVAAGRAGSAGGHHLLDRLAQDRAGQSGHREMTGDRAVVVVVHRQAHASLGPRLLTPQLGVLVRAGLGRRALRGEQGPASGPSQPGRVEAPGLGHERGLDLGALGTRSATPAGDSRHPRSPRRGPPRPHPTRGPPW